MDQQPTTTTPLVMWELTRACRLACPTCSIGAQPQRSPAELSTYEAYKTIDQIVILRPQELIMTGGDPLERPDIYQLIDYAVRRGTRPTLTLSATPALTGNSMGKLRRHGLTRIAIALDGSSPDRHDAIRGVPGQFTSTLIALRWARTAELDFEVNTLITRETIDDLTTMTRLLATLGASRWNVFFPVPMRNVSALTTADAERALEQLLTIAETAPFGIRTFEAPVGSDDIVFISHSGEVAPRPFLAMKAGNVRYQPLTAIWKRTQQH